jgi:2-methylfumaryl-CoA hydratase
VKTNPGRFFEDDRPGAVIPQAMPRPVRARERALDHALSPARHALASSDAFARACSRPGSPLAELILFPTGFGKTVPDISLNAIANLGHAEERFRSPLWPGDRLTAASAVIGLRKNANGQSGVIRVRTTKQPARPGAADRCAPGDGQEARQRRPRPRPVVPRLAPAVAPAALVVPPGRDFAGSDLARAGELHRWGDDAVGAVIDPVDGLTIEWAAHRLATRQWQDIAKVHVDTTLRPDGKRLIDGGHGISRARALSFNGLAHAQPIVPINAGTQANPDFARDTMRARSEVRDKARVAAPGVARCGCGWWRPGAPPGCGATTRGAIIAMGCSISIAGR